MSTFRRVAGKLGGLLLTLFLASLLVFFSRFLVPGDPIRFLLRGRKPSPEAVAEVTAELGEAPTVRQMGQVMKIANAKAAGAADGKRLASAVKAKLA